MKIYDLEYNQSEYEELIPEPVNTLQLFITSKCNLRCEACFYQRFLGKQEMSLNDYKKNIDSYFPKIKKVIILGGEPTMHNKIPEMIDYNNSLKLKTTIYTNGFNLDIFDNVDISNTSIRLSIYGISSAEKSVLKLKRKNLPMMIVYMLRKDNVSELMPSVKIVEEKFGYKKLFISSIRDIEVSGSYWRDSEITLPLDKYAKVVQDFIKNYRGNMEIHIARRGVLKTKKSSKTAVHKCRFGNILTNGQKIICPFDICKNLTTDELKFGERKCNKNSECLLRKITLKKKNEDKKSIRPYQRLN